MDLFELTRALVDIESTTGQEKNVGDYLFAHLSARTALHSGQIERIHAEPDRDNILACWGEPVVTLSTHMDTVPPFFGSREDGDFIWGRGSCDAKGIIAAMIAAAEKLLAAGPRNFVLLFVVGEERNSAGARAASPTLGGAAGDFLSMASPLKIASRSDRRERCAMKSPRTENSRTLLIPNLVIPPFTRCSRCFRTFGKSRCRTTICSEEAH